MVLGGFCHDYTVLYVDFMGNVEIDIVNTFLVSYISD